MKNSCTPDFGHFLLISIEMTKTIYFHKNLRKIDHHMWHSKEMKKIHQHKNIIQTSEPP